VLALLVSTVLLTGCPPPATSYILRTPEDTAHAEEWGMTCLPPRYWGGRACTPDSLNVLIGAADAVRLELRSGDVVERGSILLRRDSVSFESGIEPLTGIRFIVLRDRPDLLQRLEVSAITGAMGLGIALLPAINQDSFGEAAKTVAIGTTIGFVVGLPLGNRDRGREYFVVGGPRSRIPPPPRVVTEKPPQ
jgi:hypothetical protein